MTAPASVQTPLPTALPFRRLSRLPWTKAAIMNLGKLTLSILFCVALRDRVQTRYVETFVATCNASSWLSGGMTRSSCTNTKFGNQGRFSHSNPASCPRTVSHRTDNADDRPSRTLVAVLMTSPLLSVATTTRSVPMTTPWRLAWSACTASWKASANRPA